MAWQQKGTRAAISSDGENAKGTGLQGVDRKAETDEAQTDWYRRLARTNDWVQRWFFEIMLGCMFVGAVLHSSIAPAKVVVPYLFAVMTGVAAIKSSLDDIRRVALSPAPILLALCALHLVMPTAAFALGRAVFPADPSVTTGLVLLAAIPTGVSSLIWVNVTGGDVPLALTLVTLDSLLSPLVVPAVMMAFVGASVDFDTMGVMSSLLMMIVIPTIIGVALNRRTKGAIVKRVGVYGNLFSKVSLGVIISINVAASWQQVIAYTGDYAILFGCLLLIAVVGYIVGYVASRTLLRDAGKVSTVTYIVGMRNISAGIVLAMGNFSPLVSVPVVGATLFQQPLATLASKILEALSHRRRQVTL